jgi:hypothetical protein
MTKRTARAIAATLLSALALTATGCYREVVSAKGIGADAHHPRRVQTQEDPIDKALDPLLDPLLGPNPKQKSD